MIWRIIRPILFCFDAESVHHLSLFVLKTLYQLKLIRFSERSRDEKEVFGMQFLNSVGLAAGFDKNGEAIAALSAMGFGFVEVGTVTPRPQLGNKRPRLFRNARESKIFNRMGFNNAGAEQVAKNIRLARPHLPVNFKIGVNVGKNKDTANNAAEADYGAATAYFENLADYICINVSSPNTPGLRELQQSDSLQKIIREVRAEVAKWREQVPVLIKFAPELSAEDLKKLIQSCEAAEVSGFVLNNTLQGSFERKEGVLVGGWSGAVLTECSLANLKVAKAATSLPIVAVGGIMSTGDLQARISAGAALAQVYSGWIFSGPAFIQQLTRSIRNA